MLYNKFENKTIIKGELIAIDPIHIGSSTKNTLNPSDIDSPVLKDNRGNPVIPGSSLKGVIRSKFESILNSLENENIRACNIFKTDDSSCITKDEAKTIKMDSNMNEYEKAYKLYNKSCDVCRLFGGREIAGKLQFKDCFYIGNKCYYERRDGIAIDRETGTVKTNANYDFEIIPKDTKFDFMLIAENLDNQQIKYLEFIVKLLKGELINDDYISVGGKTTRGMGRIKLENCNIDRITKDTLSKLLELEKQEE